ncbi:MAG TPA: 2,3-bisphosphoglycerate-independent phosphoglycerate mutase [Dehalococcoidia bacterium]|nr:2,3-bisphosphoglycerate-independent phosphoglycerate mutase [Dehalococcoidia bacterium]
MDLDLLRELSVPGDTKILLLVIDGLGGLPNESGRSELEQADIPRLDRLAQESICGMTVPVAAGVTPGSGPGHLALFGYDPVRYTVGRGVLEALGIDFDLQPTDVAARGNFCTVDAQGRITDRRAGRIPTEESSKLCDLLRRIELPGVQLFVEPVRDHRFLLVLRGENLSDQLTETDPQREGKEPLPVRALAPEAEETARLLNAFVGRAREVLAGRDRANMLTLRGLAKHPPMPSIVETCKFRAGAIAAYPMYRGLAKLVGMEVIATGATFADEVETLKANWDKHDFFFIHFKKADAAGEDGDFQAKMRALEEVDTYIEELHAMQADVFMVAGDHSTPAVVAGHSWHPVPFLFHARNYMPADGTEGFNEKTCARGTLGIFPAKDVLSLAMAYAGRLTKYGA